MNCDYTSRNPVWPNPFFAGGLCPVMEYDLYNGPVREGLFEVSGFEPVPIYQGGGNLYGFDSGLQWTRFRW